MTSPPSEYLLSNTPPADKLEDYSCGWYKDRITIYPGRIYITKNTLVFHPQQIFGQLPIVINLADILALHKRNTAYVFPNAIEIVTKDQQKYFFTSFLYRDQAFSKLQELLPNAQRCVEHDGDEQMLSDEDKIMSDDDKIMSDDDNPDRSVCNTISNNSPQQGNILHDLHGTQRSPISIHTPKALRRTPSIVSSDDEDGATATKPKQSNSAFAAWRRKASEKMNQSLEMETRALISPAPESLEDTGSKEATKSDTEGTVKRILDFDTTSTINAATTSLDKEEHTAQKRPAMKQDESTPKRPTITPSSSTTKITTTPAPTTPTTTIPASGSSAIVLEEPKKIDPVPLAPESSQPMPPTSSSCEHMEYVYGADFQPFITERFPVSVAEFYRLILGSNFWSEVNDIKTTITPWLPSIGSSQAPCCQHRQINFRMNLSGKIGPKSTRVQQTQKSKLKSQNELVLETSSISKDVPYGDNFTVDSLITISAEGESACVLKLASRVKFTKSVWGISGIIEKSALAGNKDFFNLWSSMVRSKLEQDSVFKSTPSQPSEDATSGLIRRTSSTLPAPASPGLGALLTPELVAKYSPSLPASLSPRLQPPFSTLSIKENDHPLLGKLSNILHVSEITLIYFLVTMAVLALIFLPFTLYLHSRVGVLETQIMTFNSVVGKMENRISFMHVYIDHLKNNATQVDSNQTNSLKTEFEGLTHLMELTSALEHKMSDWQGRLSSLGNTLAETQKVIAGISGELGIMRASKNTHDIPATATGSSSMWFWVTLIVTLSTIAISFFYFYPINTVG